nr:unnamed protein product [Callosobruchus analis]
MEAKEKECTVMFDEVKLKKGLDLNKHYDFLEGNDDFAEYGRNAVLADSALVFYDPLENLFSVIRNRGGCNPQPIAREFRIALQHNMHIRLQNSDSSNCEVDDNELLDVTDLNTDCNEDCNNIEVTYQSLDSSQELLEQCSQPLGNSDDTCPDTEDTPLLITEIKAAQEYFSSALESDNEESPFTLESCSVAYIAGYLGKFLMDKVNCSCTAENLPLDAMDLSHTDTLIFHRDFGDEEDIRHLKNPQIDFSV